MSAATGSSDRHEAARKALDNLRDTVGILTEKRPSALDWAPDEFDLLRAAQLALEPLRALIEPPATLQTPEQIAMRVYMAVHDFPVLIDGDNMRDLITRGIHAGILAAWESWEPENAPGLVDAPAFKPEGEPDWYRDIWGALSGMTQRWIKFMGKDSEPVPGLDVEGTMSVTPDQARRILEMLSSEDAER